MNPKEWQNIDTVTEQIVIDYANLSGRESANRSEFRTLVRGHITNLLEAVAVACEGEKDKHQECYLDHCDKCEATRGFDAGLDTAANLIRSLKNHE